MGLATLTQNNIIIRYSHSKTPTFALISMHKDKREVVCAATGDKWRPSVNWHPPLPFFSLLNDSCVLWCYKNNADNSVRFLSHGDLFKYAGWSQHMWETKKIPPFTNKADGVYWKYSFPVYIHPPIFFHLCNSRPQWVHRNLKYITMCNVRVLDKV